MAKTIPFAATGSKAILTQKAFIRALLLSQKPEGYIALCRAIAQAELPPYANIKCPVLVLSGEEDKTSPIPDAQKILSDWGCSDSSKSMHILPGVGHWHCIEAADEVGSKIQEFLSKLG
ncbi:related to alpha/beta hydrolase [Fusarium oxysporum]|nr:related to alpha/beta hydrolase [Fusarium oxysporum]